MKRPRQETKILIWSPFILSRGLDTEPETHKTGNTSQPNWSLKAKQLPLSRLFKLQLGETWIRMWEEMGGGLESMACRIFFLHFLFLHTWHAFASVHGGNVLHPSSRWKQTETFLWEVTTVDFPPMQDAAFFLHGHSQRGRTCHFTEVCTTIFQTTPFVYLDL